MPVRSETEITCKDIGTGAAVTEPGSASQYRTGGWRSQHPAYDLSKCNKCGLCYIFCPDCSIRQKEDGFYEVDLEHCKGCGICAKECPKDAIAMQQEGA